MTMPYRLAAAAAIGVVLVSGAVILSRPNQSTIVQPSPPVVGSQPIQTPSPTTPPSSGEASQSVAPARPASWTAVDSMHFGHPWGTAVRLADGRVLMIGGGTTGRGEIFNPATRAWSLTTALPNTHAYQATLLLNGLVLVIGETGACCVNGRQVGLTAQLYDPTTGLWTETGLPARRVGSTATLLQDGRVLVAGGDDGAGGALFTAQIYDAESGAWTATGRMTARRVGSTATRLSDGTVLVVGGTDGGGNVEPHGPLATAEVYDPASGSWTETTAMSVPRENATATLLADGRVLVAGGDHASTSGFRPTAEIYDPATRVWTSTRSMVIARGQHTATLLLDGTVLVTGGDNGQFLSSAERFDPRTGNWSATADMPAARSAHTATLLLDGTVLVAGGYNGDDTVAFVYDPGTEP